MLQNYMKQSVGLEKNFSAASLVDCMSVFLRIEIILFRKPEQKPKMKLKLKLKMKLKTKPIRNYFCRVTQIWTILPDSFSLENFLCVSHLDKT